MRKVYLCLTSVILAFASCTKVAEADIEMTPELQAPAAITRSATNGPVVIPNPYSLSNMQLTHDEMFGTGTTLQATDIYVKFLSANQAQKHALINDCGLELFDFPLTYIMDEGSEYNPPAIPEDSATWVYTTVKPGFIFPDTITYQIIEECYIPDDQEATPTRGPTGFTLEEAAFLRVGIPIEQEEPQTRGLLKRPEGTIRVYDDQTESYVPVKGVKIRCHVFVKWSTAYTDDNGFYSMDSKFLFRPHYAIVFDNKKGFDIWANWGPIARANYNLGWRSKKGYSRDIWSGSQAWPWCTINNAAYDYYRMCEQTGIVKPPSDLKIWYSKHFSGGSSPMLKRLGNIGDLIQGIHSEVRQFINHWFVGPLAVTFPNLVKVVAPDITIEKKNYSSYDLYELVNHELSHASHFSQVGKEYWKKYVRYIIVNIGYGASPNGAGSGQCMIGEMWGYFMGHIQAQEKYPNRSTIAYPSSDYWFKPEILWDLYKNNLLTKKQIFDCLTSTVDIYDALIENMYSKEPTKAQSIKTVFEGHGVFSDVEIPNPPPPLPPTTGIPPIIYGQYCNKPANFYFAPGSVIRLQVSYTAEEVSRFHWNGVLGSNFHALDDTNSTVFVRLTTNTTIACRAVTKSGKRSDTVIKLFPVRPNGNLVYEAGAPFSMIDDEEDNDELLITDKIKSL